MSTFPHCYAEAEKKLCQSKYFQCTSISEKIHDIQCCQLNLENICTNGTPDSKSVKRQTSKYFPHVFLAVKNVH